MTAATTPAKEAACLATRALPAFLWVLWVELLEVESEEWEAETKDVAIVVKLELV